MNEPSRPRPLKEAARITQMLDLVLGADRFDRAATAPLCRKYYTNDCQGCSISTYTGRSLCEGTIYEFVIDTLRAYREGSEQREYVYKAIKKEITFLTKLLHIYRDIEAHEHSMALAELADNAYHISGRYAQDLTILNNLKARTKKGHD